MQVVQQDPIGLVLRFKIRGSDGKAVDLTPWVDETVQVLAEPQSGATRTWTAGIAGDPVDGEVVYTTASGDLDRFGRWRLQARLRKAGATEGDPPELDLRSSAAELRVEARLDG